MTLKLIFKSKNYDYKNDMLFIHFKTDDKSYSCGYDDSDGNVLFKTYDNDNILGLLIYDYSSYSRKELEDKYPWVPWDLATIDCSKHMSYVEGKYINE